MPSLSLHSPTLSRAALPLSRPQASLLTVPSTPTVIAPLPDLPLPAYPTPSLLHFRLSPANRASKASTKQARELQGRATNPQKSEMALSLCRCYTFAAPVPFLPSPLRNLDSRTTSTIKAPIDQRPTPFRSERIPFAQLNPPLCLDLRPTPFPIPSLLPSLSPLPPSLSPPPPFLSPLRPSLSPLRPSLSPLRPFLSPLLPFPSPHLPFLSPTPTLTLSPIRVRLFR